MQRDKRAFMIVKRVQPIQTRCRHIVAQHGVWFWLFCAVLHEKYAAPHMASQHSLAAHEDLVRTNRVRVIVLFLRGRQCESFERAF